MESRQCASAAVEGKWTAALLVSRRETWLSKVGVVGFVVALLSGRSQRICTSAFLAFMALAQGNLVYAQSQGVFPIPQ
jgi:hypothetical protein